MKLKGLVQSKILSSFTKNDQILNIQNNRTTLTTILFDSFNKEGRENEQGNDDQSRQICAVGEVMMQKNSEDDGK